MSEGTAVPQVAAARRLQTPCLLGYCFTILDGRQAACFTCHLTIPSLREGQGTTQEHPSNARHLGILILLPTPSKGTEVLHLLPNFKLPLTSATSTSSTACQPSPKLPYQQPTDHHGTNATTVFSRHPIHITRPLSLRDKPSL